MFAWQFVVSILGVMSVVRHADCLTLVVLR